MKAEGSVVADQGGRGGQRGGSKGMGAGMQVHKGHADIGNRDKQSLMSYIRS